MELEEGEPGAAFIFVSMLVAFSLATSCGAGPVVCGAALCLVTVTLCESLTPCLWASVGRRVRVAQPATAWLTHRAPQGFVVAEPQCD